MARRAQGGGGTAPPPDTKTAGGGKIIPAAVCVYVWGGGTGDTVVKTTHFTHNDFSGNQEGCDIVYILGEAGQTKPSCVNGGLGLLVCSWFPESLKIKRFFKDRTGDQVYISAPPPAVEPGPSPGTFRNQAKSL